MRRHFVLAVLAAAFLFGCRVSDTGLDVSGTADPDGSAGGTGLASGAGGSGGNGSHLDGGLTDGGAVPCVGATGAGKASGQSCACAGECASGFCTDGVCCDEACSGQCRTCASAGDKGRCKLVEAGQSDPHNVCTAQAAESCGTTGQCDGQGQCAKHPKDTPCGDLRSCEGTTYRGAGSCNGSGTCTPSALRDCAPYGCASSGCLSRCEGPQDCAPGVPCSEGKCGRPSGPGAACNGANECDSGFCVKGVCCNEACNGVCRSCALAGTRGLCKFIPAGQIADVGDCPADAGLCGRTGACDGQGQCAFQAAGSVCGPASCELNVERPASTCNGTGTCVAAVAKPCNPYICGGASACLSTCANDRGCSGGNICVLNRCDNYPILDVPFRILPPTLGGIIDPVWDTASQAQTVDNYVVGTAVNNFDVQFRAFWTVVGLHVLVKVQDATKVNDSPGQGSYEDDTVEIYIDADGSRGTTLDGINDHHFLFGWNDTDPQNVSLHDKLKDVKYGQPTWPAGYAMEITFPWTTLGTTPQEGKIFGLDLHVNDDDDGGPRDRKVAWFTIRDTSFMDPSSYARVRLTGL